MVGSSLVLYFLLKKLKVSVWFLLLHFFNKKEGFDTKVQKHEIDRTTTRRRTTRTTISIISKIKEREKNAMNVIYNMNKNTNNYEKNNKEKDKNNKKTSNNEK